MVTKGLAPVKKVTFDAFEKQQRFIDAVFDPKYKYLLYGGAIRGGKSFVAIAIVLILCKLFPGSRHAIVRRDLPTVKRNVLPVFNKLVPPRFVKSFNKSELVVNFTNGSELMFMAESFADDKELNRFKGLEVNTFILEEMNELQEATFYKCIERSGAWIMPENPCPSLVIGTCNPSQGWVKQLFYNPWKAGQLEAPFFYLPAKITDNPFIPAEYLDGLKALPPEVYKVFVDGSWEAVDAANQLISWQDIDKCKRALKDQDEVYSLGADIGRNGPDPTVITILKGGNIHKIEKYPKTKINECVDIIERAILTYDIEPDKVCVDSVGLGAGVVDGLEVKGYYVIPMVGGSTNVYVNGGVTYRLTDLTEHSHYHFKNWKAHNYWSTAQAMRDGLIGGLTNDMLRSDSGAIWYYVRNDKEIFVEKKEDLKKRIGRSPDFWDSFCYAVWARIADSIVPLSIPFTSSQLLAEQKAEAKQKLIDEVEAKAA